MNEIQNKNQNQRGGANGRTVQLRLFYYRGIAGSLCRERFPSW